MILTQLPDRVSEPNSAEHAEPLINIDSRPQTERICWVSGSIATSGSCVSIIRVSSLPSSDQNLPRPCVRRPKNYPGRCNSCFSTPFFVV